MSTSHTMCQYPGPSPSCSSQTIFRELSSEAREAILERHNDYRRRVAKGQETGGINPPQPAASNMKKLVILSVYIRSKLLDLPPFGLK